jgi:carboxymethylenebutenolidase
MSRLARVVCPALLIAVFVACGSPPADEAASDRNEAEKNVEAMAREHADDAPVASGLTRDVPEGVIDERDVAYAEVEGASVTGFLAEPAEGSDGAPGLIVIHEWWGLNDNIRQMARLLAAEGYRALAVDLYEGETAGTAEAARALMQGSIDRDPQLRDNLRQAHAFLRERGSSKIGSIGWCFGGAWSLRTALMFGDQLDAAVIFYGRLVTEADELASIEAPILGIFGAEDQGIPLDSVRAFEDALDALGKNAEIHVYEGADHAFANPSGTRYQPDAAAKAWSETLAFLDAHLTPAAP